jgi:UDP-N-acetylmuramyl pentapeptide phosphotransferase/UDP-N-acetylglucosamine-1-phosphate transferase
MAARVVRSAGVGAFTARVALAWIRRDPRAGELHRTNFHGRTVTLAGGPALAAGATLGAAFGARSAAVAAAAFTAGAASGAVGFYDDVAGNRPEQKAAKGFRGHLAALRDGRVTSGLVKIGGVGAAGLAAAALLAADRGVKARRRGGAVRATADVLLGAGVIAGTANLVNLLDLRPGRAGKVAVVAAATTLGGPAGGLVAGPLGATLGVLPDDLGERVMLGDCGANAVGALLGLRLASLSGRGARAGLLAAVVGLTLASEKVSFTKVIEATPGLRELDRFGRLPS